MKNTFSMSLRYIAKIVGEDDDSDDDDPSLKQKQSGILSVVKGGTIWLFHTLFDSRRGIRKILATVLSGMGFFYSASVELLLTSRNEYKNQWLPLLEELNLFLQKSGIAVELERGIFNYRFLSNIGLLARIQDKIMMKNGAIGVPPNLDRRGMASLEEDNNSSYNIDHQKSIRSTIEDGRRLMTFATAAYGISMIDAADIDVFGTVKSSEADPVFRSAVTGSSFLLSLKSSLISLEQQKKKTESISTFCDQYWLLTRVSEHTHIPKEDLYLMNLSDKIGTTLRFFIAVDHTNKAIVLSIRGSLTVKEIIIDIAGFSKPFCGGQAHAEMANAAEKVWDLGRETITKLLNENQGYELVLTGHSLGAGSAALLNILLHENNSERVNGRDIRCFAYASPPVFTGEAKKACKMCVNFIHDSDCVPFLSCDSVRHIFAGLHAIEECNLSVWTRTRILWGSIEAIDPLTIHHVENALYDNLSVKEGAPVLLIPAHVNIWMKEVAHRLTVKDANNLTVEALVDLPASSPSNFILADSKKLAHIGISFHPSMITNHFPNGYESSLYNLRC